MTEPRPPLAVACPHCQAPTTQPCQTAPVTLPEHLPQIIYTERLRRPHVARWRAALAARLTPVQR